MNKPAHPVAAPPLAYPDYHKDGFGWAMAQAAIIREGRIDSIDWENVAEEIESVGKTEYRVVESALRLVLLHQLKWRHQETHQTRSWANSINEHLRRFDEELSDNPSLRPKLEEILARAYRRARSEAAQETGLAMSQFPVTPPSWDEIRKPYTFTMFD
jgi:Domain of unknown function DUF29